MNVISDQTVYGRNTIVEANGSLYYLGDELPNLESAMCAWQSFHDRNLTLDELNKVLSDNEIALDAFNGE